MKCMLDSLDRLLEMIVWAENRGDYLSVRDISDMVHVLVGKIDKQRGY